MNRTTGKREILEMATEDFCGLWEIIWRLRDLFPQCLTSELRNKAESAVRELSAKGLIELYRRVGVSGEEKLIPIDEVDRVLSDTASWEEPSKAAVQMLLATTAKGERVYYQKKPNMEVEGKSGKGAQQRNKKR
jgi:hypothetical protein